MKEEITAAIQAASDDQRIRSEALKLAIQAVRKMPYGNPGRDSTIALAEAFYKFLKGE